jgi:hypothetical protein
MDATLIALVPLPQRLSIRLPRNVFRRSQLSLGGFVVAQVLGQSQGRRLRLTIQTTFDKHKDYWMNSLAMATVARMLSEGRGIKPGVHFVAEAADPNVLMAELRRGGLEHTESPESCDSGNLR